ncbi:MAG: N5-glutamine methyltransferase family protein [Mycobacteriaceae bacterium]|uniref:N5-glutamine methyltransferase family protein n=1 Tax=Corynebacterium sp. TaxID=1720 RepID=UPI003F9D123E
MATVSEALRSAVGELTEAGVESAAHDARALMAQALSESRGERVGPMDLVLRGSHPTPEDFPGMLARRVAREPLQWILGTGTVAGLDLAVGPGLFIPRPETDLLIDWAAGEAQRRAALSDGTGGRDAALVARILPRTLTVVDLCSGPGTIALGTAHLMTARGLADILDIRVVGLEINGAAVDAARANTLSWKDAGHVDDRIAVEFHVADVSSPDAVIGLGFVASGDIVVSNPPYVPETTEVSPEVARDPREAVFSGEDGLELMRPLSHVIDMVAAPTSVVGVEHDDGTGQGVRDLLAGVGVRDLVQHRDFAGRDRFVTGRVHRDPGHRPAR